MGISEEEIAGELRGLIFRLHGRMAAGKPVWVEKSGFDLFHVEALTGLLAGHARFVVMLRHPLDTIASNLDLMARMGRALPEMLPFLAAHPAPVEALARAWADRVGAVLDFAEGREDVLVYRFEDLLEDPLAVLARITGHLGAAQFDAAGLQAALAAPARPGLGDWKTHGETALNPAAVGRSQMAISRRAAGGLMAHLAPVMARAGYDPIPVPRALSRAEAIRQFGAAARLAARPGPAA